MAPIPPANEDGSTPPANVRRIDRDDLDALKADLLHHAEEEPSMQDRAMEFVHRRPYVSTAIALAAGLLIGSVPAARKAAALAGALTAKRFATRYVTDYLHRR